MAALLVVGVVTHLAGEQTEAARLRSFDDQGVLHAARLWVVDLDGVAWVLVARPERHWFQRLLSHPKIEIVRHDGATEKVRATPDPSAETKAAIDRAFRAKYRLVDWGYGVLLRGNPIPVRFDAAPFGSRP